MDSNFTQPGSQILTLARSKGGRTSKAELPARSLQLTLQEGDFLLCLSPSSHSPLLTPPYSGPQQSTSTLPQEEMSQLLLAS